MNEPTQEQIKRFWEHFDIEIEKFEDGVPLEFIRETGGGARHYLPHPIDLNNLFEYAVPELFQKVGTLKLEQILEDWVEMICRRDFINDSQQEALALFWSIDKVREVEGGKR